MKLLATFINSSLSGTYASSLVFQSLVTGLILAAVSVCPAISAPEPARSYALEKKAYELCRQSDSLINAKSYDRATTVLQDAAKLDPTSYSAHVHTGLARCYRRLGQQKRALKEIDRAIKFDPDHEDTLYNAAVTYFNLEHYDTALHYLQKVRRKSKNAGFRTRAQKLIDEIEIYSPLNKASRLLETGHYTAAIKLLRKSAARDPSPFSKTIHSNLAYALRHTGKPEQAIIEAKKSLKYDPNDKDTVYSLAISYQDIGQFDDAISWLKRYVSLETDRAQKDKASEFIQNLVDDRSKVDPTETSLPDYLDRLKDNDDIARWSEKSLPIKISIGSGKGVKGYRSSFDSFITTAMDTWCAASGNKLDYIFVDSEKDSDINIVWTSRPLTYIEKNRDRKAAGLTTPTLSGPGNFEHAKVEIRTVNPYNTSAPVKEGECASVCMHELGHALGLRGHSLSVSDIMYYSSSSKQTGHPTARDRATIARLYKAYPVLKFIPKAKPRKSPVRYLPPPAFVPPRPPDPDKLKPPLFIPPPVKSLDERLPPPLFVPPPVPPAKGAKSKPKKPIFIPPPVKKKKSSPPFFTPPPVN